MSKVKVSVALTRVEPGKPLLALGNVLDGLRRMVEGQPVQDIAVWSNFVSGALLGSLAVTENDGWHAVLTLLTAALFLAFLARSALTPS